jgi:hypothetical protein
MSPASVTLTPGAPSQTVTVMVNAAASSAVPSWKLLDTKKWTPIQILTLVGVLCMGGMLIWWRGSQRRWSTAFALIAFAVLVSIGACGGGSSNSGGGGGGGNGGTPQGTTTATVTATSGTTTTTMNFTLTVN